MVYNTDVWEKLAEVNQKFVASVKDGKCGIGGRPCVSGLFRRWSDKKVGMVTSCHLDHCE